MPTQNRLGADQQPAHFLDRQVVMFGVMSNLTLGQAEEFTDCFGTVQQIGT
jgi:hypothetical protein